MPRVKHDSAMTTKSSHQLCAVALNLQKLSELCVGSHGVLLFTTELLATNRCGRHIAFSHIPTGEPTWGNSKMAPWVRLLL